MASETRDNAQSTCMRMRILYIGGNRFLVWTQISSYAEKKIFVFENIGVHVVYISFGT